MKLTPLDIEQRTFEQRMRGFDRDQVRMFLVEAGRAYEDALTQREQLRDEVARKDEEIARLRAEQVDVRRALVSAEKLGESVKESARKEADAIVSAAERRGELMLEAARERVEAAQRELDDLRVLKRRFAARVRAEVQEALAVVGRSNDGSLGSAEGPEAPALYPLERPPAVNE